MVVKGTGFRARSLVRLNGVSKPTTYVSATELRAAIPASDVTTQKTIIVTVATSAPGGGVSNRVNFTVTAPAVTPCTIDEPNNRVGTAKTPALGTVRRYAICSIGDKDFIRIDAVAGTDYIIDAFNVGANLDVVIEGFDANGALIGTVNGPGVGGTESARLFNLVTGPYYVAFSELGNNAAGSGSGFVYDIQVISQPAASGSESGSAATSATLESQNPGATKAE